MTDKEQTAALAGELGKVIERFRDEFDITLAVAIGCLEIVKLELFREQTQDNE